jgi:hypothetical protein
VPDDLLRHVSGPTPYSWWWLVAAVLLLALLAAWYGAVFAVTAPERRVRDLPVIGPARTAWAKRRHLHAVRAIAARHRAGDLAAAPAAAALGAQVRAFLAEMTGARAQYMQVPDVARGELRAAAPLLGALNDAQFNSASQVDVAATADEAEELIREWN